MISVHMTSGPFPAAPRCLSITTSPLLHRAGLQLMITWAGPADGEKSRNIIHIFVYPLVYSVTTSILYIRMKFISRYSWRSSVYSTLKSFRFYDFYCYSLGSFVFLRGFYLEIALPSNVYPIRSYIIDLRDNGYLFSNSSLFSLLTVGKRYHVYVSNHFRQLSSAMTINFSILRMRYFSWGVSTMDR